MGTGDVEAIRTGKELVVKFSSGLASAGTFYADSNGREMIKRQRDQRGASYPPLVVNEPVAGNYYPVNSLLSLDDGAAGLDEGLSSFSLSNSRLYGESL